MPSPTQPPRALLLRAGPFLLFGSLVLVLLACRATLTAADQTRSAEPSPTLVATATATPAPTATPLPNRLDCGEIRASRLYLNQPEQEWFVANCQVKPSWYRSAGELPGVGRRIAEIYRVDQSICRTGFVAFTILHEPDMEAFSYEFRSFCSFVGRDSLTEAPGLFACSNSGQPRAEAVLLEYLDGFVWTETEVVCPEDEITPLATEN